MSQYPPQPPQGPWQPSGPLSPQDPRKLQEPPQWQGPPPQPNTSYQQPSGPQWPQQQPFYTQPNNYQQPPPQYQRPPMMPPPGPPQAPKKKLSRRTWMIIGIGVLVLIIFNAIFNAAKGNDTPTAAAPTATATAIIVNSQATDTPIPSTPTPQVVHYPPTTEADLRGLAAQGDASAIHEFHSESVGLVGACPQPKREVTVEPSLTGRQLAEDLLAYFYGQQIDSPCGSIVFAYHTQAEANDPNSSGYTAGRINFDVTDSSGAINVDPNASNLTYKLTLDTGDVLTGQEYVVTY